jgi:hypothetical protein
MNGICREQWLKIGRLHPRLAPDSDLSQCGSKKLSSTIATEANVEVKNYQVQLHGQAKLQRDGNGHNEIKLLPRNDN